MNNLIQSIYDAPEDWRIGAHTLTHVGGFRLWVADGILFVGAYHSGVHITIIQKIKFWRAFKWWCANAPISVIR